MSDPLSISNLTANPLSFFSRPSRPTQSVGRENNNYARRNQNWTIITICYAPALQAEVNPNIFLIQRAFLMPD
jgi:hypothetical protein